MVLAFLHINYGAGNSTGTNCSSGSFTHINYDVGSSTNCGSGSFTQITVLVVFQI